MPTVKSVQITALDANQGLNPIERAGKLRSALGTITIATGNLVANDVVLLTRIPSNARVKSIVLKNDDLDSNGTPTLAANIGLYAAHAFTDGSTSYAKGAAIAASCYATAITTLQSANVLGVDHAYEAKSLGNGRRRVWEDAGLSKDPGIDLDLAMTFSTGAATAVSGVIHVEVEYIVE